MCARPSRTRSARARFAPAARSCSKSDACGAVAALLPLAISIEVNSATAFRGCHGRLTTSAEKIYQNDRSHPSSARWLRLLQMVAAISLLASGGAWAQDAQNRRLSRERAVAQAFSERNQLRRPFVAGAQVQCLDLIQQGISPSDPAVVAARSDVPHAGVRQQARLIQPEPRSIAIPASAAGRHRHGGGGEDAEPRILELRGIAADLGRRRRFAEIPVSAARPVDDGRRRAGFGG